MLNVLTMNHISNKVDIDLAFSFHSILFELLKQINMKQEPHYISEADF